MRSLVLCLLAASSVADADNRSGTYTGQSDRMTRTKDGCTVADHVRLTMSIDEANNVTWSGFVHFAHYCPGSTGRQAPWSCWTDGSGSVSAGRSPKLSIRVNARWAGPSDTTTGHTIWSCGGVRVAVPEGDEPPNRRCVQLGPEVDERLHRGADEMCAMGRDFDELDGAELQFAKNAVTLSIGKGRAKRRIGLRLQPDATPVVLRESAPRRRSSSTGGTGVFRPAKEVREEQERRRREASHDAGITESDR